MIDLVCPHCRSGLNDQAGDLVCRGCQAHFPLRNGIPDLHVLDDLYLPNDRDKALAGQVRTASIDMGFRATVELYLSLDDAISDAQRARQVEHIVTAGDRVSAWIEAVGTDIPDGSWLDLGCGSGSFLAVAAKSGIKVIGLDVAERWLVVAEKRLAEDGLADVRLVCGNSEKLPFNDQTFAVVIAGDVIEHVSDQALTVAEAFRVLKPGGRLFMATPNRFSLTPEPHVGVWGVGFLPRPWMNGYVWLMRRVEFRAVRTMGYFGWSRLMRGSPFGGADISVSPLPVADLAVMPAFKRVLGRAYNRFVMTWLGRVLMCAIGPLFHINATRRPSPGPLPPTNSATSKT